uniref:Uncharacterized protein n=1 Tax=Ditylenchus dipsaci TaxID=166011 RepID=A0A915DCV1_9BILA
MINCRWETPDLDLISDCLPQLKSIVVESVMGSAFTNFTSLLTKCNQLEVLQIRDDLSYLFWRIATCLPAQFYDEIEAVKEGDQKHMLYLSRPSDKLSANQSRWVKYCNRYEHLECAKIRNMVTEKHYCFVVISCSLSYFKNKNIKKAPEK